jgi:CoA:oxalate CoA-transferase
VPLSGIKVVDLTRVLSGPFCTMLLADMGADVIKIEPPGRGDPVRGQGAGRNGLSWYFAAFNRNKRSLTLDLRHEAGKAALARLLEDADILAENYRPGVLDIMGFDADRLKAINPRLIVCSVSGFGSSGPYVERPAFDFVTQAMSGFMATSGTENGPPMRAGPPISDLIAGLYAAFGAVSALHARTATGVGQRVESSLVNSLISMLAFLSVEYFATGLEPKRHGNNHPVVAPYGLFRAADGGDVAIAPSTPDIYQKLMQALDLTDLMDDPRYVDNAARLENRTELHRIVGACIAKQPAAYWIDYLNRAGVPCGPVLGLADVFSDPQVLAQEMVIDVPHPGRGDVRMTGFPVKFSDTPCRIRRPAPELGAHTEEVLQEAGFNGDEIAALRAATTIS